MISFIFIIILVVFCFEIFRKNFRFLFATVVSTAIGEKFLKNFLSFIIELREEIKIQFYVWKNDKTNIVNSEILQLTFYIDTQILQFLNNYYLPYGLLSDTYLKSTTLMLSQEKIVELTAIEKKQKLHVSILINKTSNFIQIIVNSFKSAIGKIGNKIYTIYFNVSAFFFGLNFD